MKKGKTLPRSTASPAGWGLGCEKKFWEQNFCFGGKDMGTKQTKESEREQTGAVDRRVGVFQEFRREFYELANLRKRRRQGRQRPLSIHEPHR